MIPTRSVARKALAPLRAAASDRLVLNAGWMWVNLGVSAALGLLGWVVAARCYSVRHVGAVSATVAAASFVAIVATLGLTETTIRHLQGVQNQQRFVAKNLLIVSLAGLVAGVVWWMLTRHVLQLQGVGAWEALGILCASAVAVSICAVTDGAIIASRRPALLLFETVVGGVVRLSAFAFVSFGASGLLLSYALAVIAATFVSLLVVYRRLGLRSSGIANIPRTQSFAASNWVSGIASLVPWGLTPLLVASSQGAKAATWVAIPLLTGALFAAVPGLLARSLFAEASKSPEHLGRLLRRALPRALTLTALTSGGAALAAPFILRLFGPEYAAHSTTLFRLLALSALVSVPNFFADVVLNVRRDVLGFAYANVLGCCAFFGVILVAIHGSAGGSPTAVGWGWVGGNAAYGLIACFFAVRRRYRGDRFGSTIAEAQRVR